MRNPFAEAVLRAAFGRIFDAPQVEPGAKKRRGERSCYSPHEGPAERLRRVRQRVRREEARFLALSGEEKRAEMRAKEQDVVAFGDVR
jgi:DNA-binding transcriptional regulator PaaX